MKRREPKSTKTANQLDLGAGALLMPPKPPPEGTIRLLLPPSCIWSMRQHADVMQLDITVVPHAEDPDVTSGG